MRTLLGTYDIWDKRASAPHPCELYEGIAEHNLQCVEQEWQPGFRAAQAAKVEVQDAHWDWRRKHQYVEPRISYRSFVVECDGKTQGLMIVELAVHRCRLPEQVGKHVVYVDFLATAPWNRSLDPNPRFKGVGRLLLSTAINVSFDEQFEGRIGLHALPDSAAFYSAHAGMTNLGPDTGYPGNLAYFEMTKHQAELYFADRT